MTYTKTSALATILVLTLLSGCVGPPSRGGAITSAPMAAQFGPPQPLFGYDAHRLIARFGKPRLDIRDRTVRKLQFMTGGCVLDTYLYITARGREPVVTHIDTRNPDGTDVDPGRCGIK